MDQTSRTRTHLLRERVTTPCQLTADDVAFLLAEHGTHVALLPTRRRGRYLLTPRGYVGTIRGPHCRLILRPKVPLPNLFLLLDPDTPVPVSHDDAGQEPGTEALEFLARRLAQLLDERAIAGLHRAYVERTTQGHSLQGRLDLPAQLRQPSCRKDTLHSRYDERTADVPCNQVPKATAELALRSPLLSQAARGMLLHVLQAFADVAAPALGPDSFAVDELTRLNEAYRPLLDLCRLVVESLGPSALGGSLCCPAFLLDMERVFERYVTRTVASAFVDSGCEVQAQPLYHVNRRVEEQPDIAMRPDVVVGRAGKPVLVVDAKWKTCRGTPLVRDDVHQALAYASGLAVARVVLVYPGRRDRSWRYDLARSAIRVEMTKLRVVGSAEECRRSRQRLERFVRFI